MRKIIIKCKTEDQENQVVEWFNLNNKNAWWRYAYLMFKGKANIPKDIDIKETKNEIIIELL